MWLRPPHGLPLPVWKSGHGNEAFEAPQAHSREDGTTRPSRRGEPACKCRYCNGREDVAQIAAGPRARALAARGYARRAPRRSREVVVALTHARVGLRPRLPARGASRRPRFLAVRAFNTRRPELTDGVRLSAARRIPRRSVHRASRTCSRRPRHCVGRAGGAGHPRPRRSARLALLRGDAAVDADDLGHPSGHGCRRAGAGRRAPMALA
jgi:hypothetical protein